MGILGDLFGGRRDTGAQQFVPPPPPPAAAPPTVADPSIGRALDDERRRQRAAQGRDETILTRPGGLRSDQDTGTTLLTV
jgi:hypothetical protein